MSSDTTDPGVRITRIGLMVNLGMVVTKGVGGWVFNSQALVSDAPLEARREEARQRGAHDLQGSRVGAREHY
jgi:hypothetical protein